MDASRVRGTPRAHGALASGIWFVAAATGQALTLQLIQAGPVVAYQHYSPLPGLFRERPLQLLYLAALLIAVACSSRRLWPVLAGAARRVPPVARLFVAAMFFLTAAALARDPSAYFAELLLAGAIQVLALGSVAMAIVSLPEGLSERLRERLDLLLEAPTASRWGLDRYTLVLALGVAAVAAVLALASYQRHPHVPDEVDYLFQARYFARGWLTMPPPPVPAGFEVDMLQMDATRWFSVFPPGWPAVLALGVMAGVPWLVNPVLGGLNVILATVLLGGMYDRRTTRIAVALLAFSPWHLFMAMSFMSHILSLTLALAAAVGIAAASRTGRAAPALAAGLAVGIIGHTRPLEGVVVATLLGIALLVARGRRFGPLAGLGAGMAITGGLGLWYNRAITGSVLRFPVEEYFAKVYGAGHYEIGFGASRGLGWTGLDPLPGHGLLDVLVNANLNAFAVNAELLGWWTGSLLPVLLGAVLTWRYRSTRVMLAAIAAVVLAQSFYWFSGGPDFGARYWFLIIVPCLALAATGIESLRPPGDSRSGPAHLMAAALSLMALLTFVPWRALDKYHHYRGMRPDVRRIAKDPRLQNAIVLVRGARHPDYASAAVYNPIGLRGSDPVFVWDRNEETRTALQSRFPERSFWILEGPTVTGEGYRLSEGPLPPPSGSAPNRVP